jgi:ribosomal protein S6--L-glutamate ligase
VEFAVHPLQRDADATVRARARLLDERWVRSSSGRRTFRPVIVTTLVLGSNSWPIELTLVRRDLMGFRMLVGREALRRRAVVDPGRSYLAGRCFPPTPRRGRCRPHRAAAARRRPAMKIGILSRRPDIYSTRRLREAAEARGHHVEVVDYLRCYMNITAERPAVMLGGRELDFDAVVPRIGASHTFYGTAVVRQFEVMGVFPCNESTAIVRARDKLRSVQLLAREGISLPVTGFAHSIKDVEALVKAVAARRSSSSCSRGRRASASCSSTATRRRAR